jgi:hypothetical protein
MDAGGQWCISFFGFTPSNQMSYLIIAFWSLGRKQYSKQSSVSLLSPTAILRDYDAYHPIQQPNTDLS